LSLLQTPELRRSPPRHGPRHAVNPPQAASRLRRGSFAMAAEKLLTIVQVPSHNFQLAVRIAQAEAVRCRCFPARQHQACALPDRPFAASGLGRSRRAAPLNASSALPVAGAVFGQVPPPQLHVQLGPAPGCSARHRGCSRLEPRPNLERLVVTLAGGRRESPRFWSVGIFPLKCRLLFR